MTAEIQNILPEAVYCNVAVFLFDLYANGLTT